jgi:hypothetical protein
MKAWVNVARYHLVRPGMYLGMPWAIMAFSFAVNVVIFGLWPRENWSPQDSGAVSVIYIFFLVMGVTGAAQSLPFGLALGVSRRSYYTGTALLAVTIAAADALPLTALQAIERATGGWGENLFFFRVPYILDGPWYLTWLTSFVVLVLAFVYGMWYSIVYRIWRAVGTLTFLAAQVTGLSTVGILFTWAHVWPLAAPGLTGLLAALTVLLLAGGYAAMRRVTV